MSEISTTSEVDGFVRADDAEGLGGGVAVAGGSPMTVTAAESASSMIPPDGKGSSPSGTGNGASGDAGTAAPADQLGG